MNYRASTSTQIGDTAEMDLGATQKFGLSTNYPRLRMPPENIILAGIQGAGKGTYGKNRLVTREGYDLFEASTRMKKSTFATEAAPYIAEGQMVPDRIPLSVMSEYLDARSQIASLLDGAGHKARRTIWDGMPRTSGQKKGFDAMLRSKAREPAIVVKLEMSDETAWSNIRHRAAQPDARADDRDIGAITRRIKNFHEQTEPLLEEYDKEGRLIVIHAAPDMDLNNATEEQAQAAFEKIYTSVIHALNERFC